MHMIFFFRSSPLEVILEKDVPKIIIKFKEEQPYQNGKSIKLLWNL